MQISVGRAAPITGIIIVALMIEGTIPIAVDDAWLWALLSLFSLCLLQRGRDWKPWRRWIRDWVGDED